ncbi:MAG: tetratricopeptide repeat protein [Candidatus Cloacimonetes bacterium]|nr:tetratricopeptide repeat protein [Candidatus Cloacimonadota bacterium]
MNKNYVVASVCLAFILMIAALSGVNTYPDIKNGKAADYISIKWMEQNQAFRQAESAIDRFVVLYPESIHSVELFLLKAQILLEQGRYQEALRQLQAIIDIPGNHYYKADIILKQVITYYYLDLFSDAEQSLQRLISEYSSPQIQQQYHYWRGMINLQQSQPYSALHSFQQAANLGLVDKDLDYHLFILYLMIDREDIARSILESYRPDLLDSALPIYVHWLSNLLTQGRFTDLDREIAPLETDFSQLPRQIQSIFIRYKLLRNQYGAAAQMLSAIGIRGDECTYYYALLLSQKGDVSRADSLLADLEQSPDQEIALLSKLERIKILYRKTPDQAKQLIISMLDQAASSRLKGELYFLLAAFQFHEDDLTQALSNMLNAKKYNIEAQKHDLIDSLIPEIWLLLQGYRNAKILFNRYLNSYPEGGGRAKALYMLAVLSYLDKDYQSFWAYYNRFMEDHSSTIYADQARFYAAEVDFNLANYSRSLPLLQTLYNKYPSDPDIITRLAQTHYYLGEYLEAKVLINAIPGAQTNYDAAILNASIHFNEKDYMRALELYRSASILAPSEVKRIEALSYQALVLYQLRRFKDASDLYYQIAKEQGTPETYLYMAAKSAIHARNFNQALTLFDAFLNQYPNSKHCIRVLNDIASVCFNMGNYDGAITTWNNVLRRYISKKSFTDEELALLREIFAGLDYSFRLNPRDQYIDELITMIDAFSSEYIQFELQYLLIKLYAGSRQWQNLIRQAEDLRRQFPQRYVKELEILTAESLIQLNEFAKAESVFVNILEREGMSEILFEWVELDIQTGQYSAALQKLRHAFNEAPDQQIWLTMLDIAYQHEPDAFRPLWDLADAQVFQQHPEAMKLNMLYLYEMGQYNAAAVVSTALLEVSSDPLYRAYGLLMKAIILYQQEAYSEALPMLDRLVVSNSDNDVIFREALFYVILCKYATNNADDARVIYQTNLDRLTIDQIRYLDPLLNSQGVSDEN